MGWLSGSYFGRHWRGELSLGLSYWLNGVIGGIVALLITLAIAAALHDRYNPVPGLLAVCATWMVQLGITTWQVVGTWRSASRHTTETGRTFWAGAAKVMLTVSCLHAGYTFATSGWPQIHESVRIVAGDPTVGTYELHLLNAGTELEFLGGIPFGATRELGKMLDAAPTVRVLHLNSRGGRLAEARRMRDLIRARGLITYTATQCVSACTVAYLGGVQRYINPRAVMGFHKGGFPGVTANELTTENEREIREAVQFGVDGEFARRAWSVANDSLWKPPIADLIAAHYVTAVSNGQFGLSGFGAHPVKDDVARQLREASVFDAVAVADPGRFSKIMDRVMDGLKTGEPEGQVFAATRDVLSDLVRERLPHASDAALLALLGVVNEELASFKEADQDACFYFLFPAPGHYVDVGNYFGKETRARDLEASDLVVRSSLSGIPHVLDRDRVLLLQRMVANGLRQKYGPDVLNRLSRFGSPQMPQHDACGLAQILFREAATVAPEYRADVARLMLTGNRGQGGP